MMPMIKDYDADSYELEFEEDTPEEERQFYVKRYPNVNMVADCRLHCTTCNAHLGCAVANELSIRMHPVLRVTHCKKCHTFYNSGEFSKGEDGSELYCRWCGQGGEVYCCAKCPYVFCKKCIVQNLPRGKINEISNNDNWNCFSCSPREMWELRAQHWALVNYIEKTKQKILSEEKDDDKIYELMNKDPTLCCRDKKVQKRSKDSKRRRKRRYSSTSSSGCSTPEPKRIQDHSAVLPKMVTTPVQQKSAKQSDELVCTPDILSMFSEPAEETAARVATKTAAQATSISVTPAAAVAQKSATSQPPPLIIRQLPSSSQQTVRFPNRQFSAVQRPAAPPPPAYYTVNGFRVDLNAAAQQETYRLPNGKLIQVKKQTAANQANAANAANAANSANRSALPAQPRTNNTNPNPYSIRFNVPPSLPVQPIQIHPQHQTLHQTHLQQQQQILNGLNNVPMVPMTPMTTVNTMPTPVTAANKYPNTPLGQAQTQLENQIHGTQDICQHTIGKLNTLMKSNAYKNVRTYNDVKELHLHLSYLFTYTIGRFKTLQDKCTEDMKALSNAHEAANKLADKKNKYTNVDDDLEVVEPTTVCIEIDSDDENEPTKTTSTVTPPLPTVTPPLATVTPPLATVTPPIPTVTPTVAKVSKKPKQPRKTSLQPKPHDSQPTKSVNENELAPIEITEIIDADEFELPTPPALDMEDVDTTTYDRENDEKLKSLPQVVLEKDEEIERKLKEIMDRETMRNGSVSPISDELTEEHNDAPEESINESEKESVTDSSKESGRECANESINETTNEPINESAKESVNESAKESVNESAKESVNESAKESVNESATESVNESATESVNESAKESVNESPTECVQESDEIMEISDTIVDDVAMNVSEFHKLDKINDDVTNGQKNDELTTIDLNRSDSPPLFDNLENELLDAGLTDNSFENISSPDMFDDMSKNGFEKPDMNMVHLSSENADPDLV